jgi:hypothetical protein
MPPDHTVRSGRSQYARRVYVCPARSRGRNRNTVSAARTRAPDRADRAAVDADVARRNSRCASGGDERAWRGQHAGERLLCVQKACLSCLVWLLVRIKRDKTRREIRTPRPTSRFGSRERPRVARNASRRAARREAAAAGHTPLSRLRRRAAHLPQLRFSFRNARKGGPRSACVDFDSSARDRSPERGAPEGKAGPKSGVRWAAAERTRGAGQGGRVFASASWATYPHGAARRRSNAPLVINRMRGAVDARGQHPERPMKTIDVRVSDPRGRAAGAEGPRRLARHHASSRSCSTWCAGS